MTSTAVLLAAASVGGQGGLEPPIIGAPLECVGRCGLGPTTLEDVARPARCRRATMYRVYRVYRVLPGGRDPVLPADARAGVPRVGQAVAAEIEGASNRAEPLSGAVVAAPRPVVHHRVWT